MTKNINKRVTVDFQGSLSVLTIEHVLQLLFYTGLSGKLMLLKPPIKATLFIDQGHLLWGTLHARQKRLGKRLLDAGLISESQLQECLLLHEGQNREMRLGTVMLTQGFLSPDALHRILRAQVRDAFFEVLGWGRGTFAFISNIDVEEDVTLDERIDHLLLEGIVKVDDKMSLARVR